MSFRKKIFSLNNKKVVFLLTGWKGQIWEYYFVILTLLVNGFDCVAYEYDSDMLSPDVGGTISSFDDVTNDVLQTLTKFNKRGYKDLYIFGTSLGSALSIIVANKTKHIKKIILNLTGASLAGTVWSWDTFKKDLKANKTNLKSLEKSWRRLAPINNLNNMLDKQVLIYLSKHDDVIPFIQGAQLVREFKNKQIKHRLIVNTHGGHVVSGFVNLLRYSTYIGFLKDYND